MLHCEEVFARTYQRDPDAVAFSPWLTELRQEILRDTQEKIEAGS